MHLVCVGKHAEALLRADRRDGHDDGVELGGDGDKVGSGGPE